MSMRPAIYGFKLESLKKLFGSGDKASLEKIKTMYQQRISETFCDEPNELARFCKPGEEIIRRAVMEGVPFAELDFEDDVYVYVADAIVHSVELKSPGDTMDWHMQAFRDLRCNLMDKISSDMINLLSLFEEGRPFFGKKINSSWSYYGYITAQEVKDLYIALDDIDNPELLGDLREFLFVLTDWLDGISSQGLDLYFYIS